MEENILLGSSPLEYIRPKFRIGNNLRPAKVIVAYLQIGLQHRSHGVSGVYGIHSFIPNRLCLW